jgi:hypothetical protein
MRRLLERALRAYEAWAEPRWSASEAYIPVVHPDEWMFFLRLEPDGAIRPLQTISTDVHLRYRRSWRAPWRRYAYAPLVEPKSTRTMLTLMGRLQIPDDSEAGYRWSSVDEMRQVVINLVFRTQVPDTWFGQPAPVAPLSSPSRSEARECI